MEQNNKNKNFILEYLKALSGVDKTSELLKKYIDDEKLIEHILFFERVFPKYDLLADEITSEDDRVVIYARFKGTHLGELNGIPATFKQVELPLAVGYKIKNNKITAHWIVIDQMMLLEQLGVAAVRAE
jgi:predicted ester cyclase